MRYVIEAEDPTHAADEVTCNDGNLKEFSQQHLDEIISSIREISDEEYMKMFDEDNAYLSTWTKDRKLNFINKIDYS